MKCITLRWSFSVFNGLDRPEITWSVKPGIAAKKLRPFVSFSENVVEEFVQEASLGVREVPVQPQSFVDTCLSFLRPLTRQCLTLSHSDLDEDSSQLLVYLDSLGFYRCTLSARAGSAQILPYRQSHSRLTYPQDWPDQKALLRIGEDLPPVHLNLSFGDPTRYFKYWIGMLAGEVVTGRVYPEVDYSECRNAADYLALDNLEVRQAFREAAEQAKQVATDSLVRREQEDTTFF